jgi:ABC-type Zn uptake system ZnuABC Zn-binding protein ZnuA
VVLCWLAIGASAPADKVKVVATIEDLADITRAIGGDRVEVTTIARGRENLHRVSTRPSHLVAMSRADLFVQVGLSLESAFAPALLENSRNEKIQPGKPGFVNCSDGWAALDVPASVSRKAGDVHPQGNPHMNLDPRGGLQMATRIAKALYEIDPRSKDAYLSRLDEYVKRLGEAAERWKLIGAQWKGKKLVVYHQEYNYFAAAYGIEIVGTIEERPGIPPTPNHLAELVALMKQGGVRVIATATWSNDREVEELARAAGARVVELPNQCSAGRKSETWIGMMDLIHERMNDAFDEAADK